MEAKIPLSLPHSVHPHLYSFTCLSLPCLTRLSTSCLSTCADNSDLQGKERKSVSPRMAVGTKGSAIRTHQQQTDRHTDRQIDRGKRKEEGKSAPCISEQGSSRLVHLSLSHDRPEAGRVLTLIHLPQVLCLSLNSPAPPSGCFGLTL